MATESDFLADEATARWTREIFRFLPIKSQFVLSGNIRDRYPFPMDGMDVAPDSPRPYLPLSLVPYLAEALKLRGFEHFLAYDPVNGFRAIPTRDGDLETTRKFLSDITKLSLDAEGRAPATPEKALEVTDLITRHREHFIAVFMDFASRYIRKVDSLNNCEHDFFTKALIRSYEAEPHVTGAVTLAQFNPIFWLCDKENDLPDWLILNNPRIRAIGIPKPDHGIRRTLIHQVTPSLPDYTFHPPERVEELHDLFVEQTEGMTLNDVIAITQLCRRENLPFEGMAEAVKRYKLGVTEDPWRKLDRKKIHHAEDFIRTRVKGQVPAVIKSLDIIKRAITGLSGAQVARGSGRPRGLLFLAGPTGTGKTELAKTLTELLFGDERAYIRFDMSEFTAEHADQRLIGAPPGYIGSDMGGELTNAIREKPFSVVLFDEIEKAHPRILDKFLQILDDGVLTSGRGEQVWFSEAVIVFTSNLGIYRTEHDGRRVANVTAEDHFEVLERKIRSEIDQFFKTQLNRPELLNRIGENIVVFDFIRLEVATQIFDKMLNGIFDRLKEQQGIQVVMNHEARTILRIHCTRDLSQGGRGIGNKLEAWLINPLARAIFDLDVQSGSPIQLKGWDMDGSVPKLIVQNFGADGSASTTTVT